MDGCQHLYPALVFPLLLHVPILYNLSRDPSFAPVLTHMQLLREQGYMRAKVAFPCPWKAGISKNNAVSDLISMSWYDLLSFLSRLSLSPAPSPSPSNSICPRLPAFCRLRSNSEVYSCNYAMSAL